VELYEQIRREYEHGAGTIRAVARRLVFIGGSAAGSGQRSAARAEEARAGATEAGPGAVVHRRDSGSGLSSPAQATAHAHRIWTRLQQEKAEIVVGESTVREYVRQRKAAMGCWDTRFSSRSRTSLATKHRWTGMRSLRDRRQQRKIYVFCMRSMASARPSSGLSAPQAFLKPRAGFACLAGSFAPRFDNLTSA